MVITDLGVPELASWQGHQLQTELHLLVYLLGPRSSESFGSHAFSEAEAMTMFIIGFLYVYYSIGSGRLPTV